MNKSKSQRVIERRAEAERDQALISIYGGLVDSVSHEGGDLVGLSMKLEYDEVLLTLRGQFPAGWRIAYVGAASIPGCFAKALRDSKVGRLQWGPDRYRPDTTLTEEE